MKKNTLIIATTTLLIAHTAPAQKPEEMTEHWDSAIRKAQADDLAVEQWKDMGFGIFIHWTPAVVFQGRAKGKELNTDLWGEWYMARTQTPRAEYAKRVRTWNPKAFNPAAWASLFKDSGAKYVVFVAKHHDGFALFGSNASDYNIRANKPFGRDAFGELCQMLRKEGLRTGFYYSHGTDWYNRSQFKGTKEEVEKQYWEKVVYPQLQELCKKYGKQEIAWFDLGASKEQAKKCAQIVKQYNPEIMISSRIGHGYGNFSLGGDCDIPIQKSEKPWETCMTFDWHWDWYPASRADKTSTQLIQMLAKIRARGGNLLLNIGPDIRGMIPLRESVVLEQIGGWLRINGDSIYGVRMSPYNDLPWGVCTTKKNKLYMHLLKLPRMDYAFLPGLKSPIKKAWLLSDKKCTPLKTEKTEYGHRIYLNGTNPQLFDERDTVVVVEYQGTANIDPTPVLDTDLENIFLPALGSFVGGACHGRTRVTPKPDNPSVEAPHYFDYAWKFDQPESRVLWHCINPDSTYYFVKVNYANFTSQTLKGIIQIGDKRIEVNLPPTPKNAYSCIQRARSEAFLLKKAKELPIAFQLAKESQGECTHGKGAFSLPNFMLESVEVATINPPLYESFGDTGDL